VVTILLALTAVFMLWPPQYRFFLALEEHRKMVIAYPQLRDYINLVNYRDLDRQLPPDAKIFFTGVVGPNDQLAYYYFARSVLYPREVEISVDHKADFQVEGFRGVDCGSPDQLRADGYDLLLKIEPPGALYHLSLTKKGEIK
jgi:hypothetical protein